MHNCNAAHWVSSTPYRPFTVAGRLSPGVTATNVMECFGRLSSELSNVLGGVTIAVHADGETCCHCRCACAQCHCPCLACGHWHCSAPQDTRLVMEGMVSDKCLSDCVANSKLKVLTETLSGQGLVLNPQVTYRQPLPSGQFKIFGKLGAGYNTEVPTPWVMRNDEHSINVRQGLAAEGKNRKVSELVCWYLAESRQLGMDATVTHLQVKVADVYQNSQGSFCCDHEEGHSITGTIAAPACPHHIRCQLGRFVEFLASKVAGGSPIYVVYNGERNCYSPPWAIPLLAQFQPGGWRITTGKTW